jgi:hypothetical protein
VRLDAWKARSDALDVLGVTPPTSKVATMHRAV